MNIGLAIKNFRIGLNFNQKEFAAVCSISQNSLSQIESGIKHPKEATLRKFCSVFMIPESLLYLLAIEAGDLHPSKRGSYDVLHSSISSIARQISKMERGNCARPITDGARVT